MVESPCVSICRQENGRCIGCGRTMDEIAGWWDMTDQEKQQVIDRLEQEANDIFD